VCSRRWYFSQKSNESISINSRRLSLNNLLKSNLIISCSIILSAFTLRANSRYQYEIDGADSGFVVRVDRNTGHRCLMKEGAVRVVNNWEEMASSFPALLILCKK